MTDCRAERQPGWYFGTKTGTIVFAALIAVFALVVTYVIVAFLKLHTYIELTLQLCLLLLKTVACLVLLFSNHLNPGCFAHTVTDATWPAGKGRPWYKF